MWTTFIAHPEAHLCKLWLSRCQNQEMYPATFPQSFTNSLNQMNGVKRQRDERRLGLDECVTSRPLRVDSRTDSVRSIGNVIDGE
jgi:hypothetical protein